MKIFKRKLSTKQYAAIQRLADGIECGAKIRPQTTKMFFDELGENRQLASCALGAAWECAMIDKYGADIVTPQYLHGSIADERFSMESVLATYGFKSTAKMIETHLEGRNLCNEFTYLSSLIVRLNDDFGWSRERIAEFLREVE